MLRYLILTILCATWILDTETGIAQERRGQQVQQEQVELKEFDIADVKKLMSEIEALENEIAEKNQALRKKVKQLTVMEKGHNYLAKYETQMHQKNIAQLRTLYGGTINANVDRNVRLKELGKAISLLRRWNPVSCSTDELRSLMGEPTTENANQWEYDFDNGMIGAVLRFKIRGEQVCGYEITATQ